jgi:hypothetical protein
LLVHLGILHKRISSNFCFSVKNQVAGRVDVVEDGGAEVERRREGEEGLEGPQPLHEVAGPDGANYGGHRPDAVRQPCPRGRRSRQIQSQRNAAMNTGDSYLVC